MLIYDIKPPVRNGEIKMLETNQLIDKVLTYNARRIVDLRDKEPTHYTVKCLICGKYHRIK